MHEFNIIHCDIKPENIIFSEYLNKAAFIDFGLSDIIDETFGFETFSAFKGTPNFCTLQMLDLITNRKGYVDLYYNDAYSLVQTCNHGKCLRIQSEVQSCQDEIKPKLPQSRNKNSQTIFAFYSLQFHYLNSNQLRLRQLLDTYLSHDQSIIKKVLVFIKDAIDYIFLRSFFQQSLKPFQKLIQYQEVQQKIKFSSEVFNLSLNLKDESSMNSNKYDLRSIQFLSSQLFDDNIQYDHQGYLKTILNIQKLQPQFASHLIFLVFSCIRFDQRNLDFADKLKIARKINPLLVSYNNKYAEQSQQNGQFIIKDQSVELKEIRMLMRAVLVFYLNESPQKWIKIYLFDIIQQLILLKDEFYMFIDQFFKKITENKETFQTILVIFQLQRLCQSTKLIKQSNQHKSILIFKQKCQVFTQNQYKRYISKNINAKDIESTYIYNILLEFKTDKINDGYTYIPYLQQLRHINNPDIRKHLYYLIIQKIIGCLFEQGKSTELLKLIQIVNKSADIHSADLLSRARMSMRLMFITYNQIGLSSCCKYIASVINCKEVYNDINTQLFSHHQSYTFSQQLDRVISAIPHLPPFELQTQLLLSLTKLDNINQLNNQLIQKIVYLYNAYMTIRKPIQIQKQALRILLFLYQRVQIQYVFFTLSASTKALFMNNLALSESQFDAISLKVSVFEFVLIKFKFLLSSFYYHLWNKNFQESIPFLQQIFLFCKAIRIHFIMLDIIKQLSLQSYNNLNYKMMCLSAKMLFYYCKEYNQFVCFLDPNSSQYSLTALFVFAHQDKNIFHQILINLTNLLNSNPIYATKGYFLNFINLLDQFVKRDSSTGYLLHFNLFVKRQQTSFLRTNPFLLIFLAYSLQNQEPNEKLRLLKIFALHCDSLSNFAKNKLLVRYYNVFVGFIDQKSKRQRRYVFRFAKNYLTFNVRKKETRSLYRKSKKTNFHYWFHKKISNLVVK